MRVPALDHLQQFLVTHALCVLASPDALRVGVLELDEADALVVDAICRHCAAGYTLRDLPFTRTTLNAARWWSVVADALVRAWPDAFLLSGGEMNPARDECLERLQDVERAALMAELARWEPGVLMGMMRIH